MRKPRGDSNLKTLPEDQQAEIIARLERKGGTYEKVKAWLDAEWSINCSVASLSEFYSWRQLKRDMDQTESDVANLQEWLKGSEFNLSPEEIQKVGDTVYAIKAAKGGNYKEYVAISKVLLAKKKLEQNDKVLEQNDRRIALLEKKAAQLDKAKEVMESNLSHEEQRQRLKEILK